VGGGDEEVRMFVLFFSRPSLYACHFWYYQYAEGGGVWRKGTYEVSPVINGSLFSWCTPEYFWNPGLFTLHHQLSLSPPFATC